VKIITGTQFGSNPGGISKSDSGKEFYHKTPNDPKQAHCEVGASKLYKSVGINTLNPEVHDGKHVVSPWNNDAKPFRTSDAIKSWLGDNIDHHIDLAKLHHMAVITKNHDVIGLVNDNIMRDSNENLISADQGGSFQFRAQGGHKDFLPNVDEIESFKVPHRTTGKAFGMIHPLAFDVAAREIKNKLRDDTIDSISKEHGLDSDTIKKRRDLLVKHYNA
jgi:hypothetical protein